MRDVAAAFDEFLKRGRRRPIILAGHSQGALHLERLLGRRSPASRSRSGWSRPMSSAGRSASAADLPALGLPACAAPDQTGCILSWLTFGEPANPDFIFDQWQKTDGLHRRRAAQARTRCASTRSPASQNGAAPPQDNPGTLVPTADMRSRDAAAGAVGAHCDKGLLILDGNAAALGPSCCRATITTSTTMPCSGARSGAMRNGGLRHGSADHQRAPANSPRRCQGGKLVGLDVGTKTIGVAICDAGWHFAGPAETIRRTKFTQDLEQLRGIRRARAVVGLVVGLPLSMDGSDSPRTQSVRAFARNLAPLELPILLWDERWSTQAVERAMIEADVSRAGAPRRSTRSPPRTSCRVRSTRWPICPAPQLAGARGHPFHRLAERRADRGRSSTARSILRR